MIVQRSSCSDPRFSYDFETTAEICDNAGFQRLFLMYLRWIYIGLCKNRQRDTISLESHFYA